MALAQFCPLAPVASGKQNVGPWLDPDVPGPVGQAAAEIDLRGRLRIPSRLVANIGWLHRQVMPVDALAVYDRPGRIILLSWEEESEPVLSRRRELIERASESPEALEGLRMLEDRYKRLTVPNDLRPTLGTEAFIHLDLPMGAETNVYVVRVLQALEILSPKYRNELRVTRSEMLAGLP
jgi:DNA-binding transcriptional regulator/RsmH inhibitor MraZ